MIGRFNLEPPLIDDALSQMVESHRAKTGQDYAAILLFGLWGTVDCSAEVRLYAAYRHLAENPEDGPAWLETARAHLESGDPDMALAIVDELRRNDNPGLYPGMYSEDPEVHRAHILADSGRLDEALDVLDGLRAGHGESPVYHYTIGTVLHEQGDFDAAVAAYDEAESALEEFRQDVIREELEEDIDVDFAAAASYIGNARRLAAAGRVFSGERPVELSGFCEE